MTDTTPTLAQVIRSAIDARLVDVHTALPGEIVSYDANTQTADVRPMLKRHVANVVEELPIVPSVPVMFLRGGGFFISMPLQPGDAVLLVFCERDLQRWRQTGELADPGDRRMHPLSGAVAIPGIFTKSDALADADATSMRLGSDGGINVVISPTQVQLGAEGVPLTPLLDGVVTARGVDPFTGLTYGVLGNASSAVLAKKT